VSELNDFALVLLVVAAGFMLAVGANKITERVPVPAPALFLLAAAIVSDFVPRFEQVSIATVERLGIVALIVILFDGGMHVGWRRLRAVTRPVATLGVLGTFGTGAVIAVAAHVLFDLDWTSASLLGAAVAPTDPAVMFSVLGRREVAGRTGTILEAESGANDPVGIALVVSILDVATGDGGSYWHAVPDFVVQMVVGLAVGAAAAWLLVQVMRKVTLPHAGLYPLRTLAAAGVIYGVATVAHGSGFLAVFVAGIIVGDARVPYKAEIERFHLSLASLAEIVVFAALGLTIHLGDVGHSVLLDGLALALVLLLVARPLATAPLLALERLRTGERLFVMWSGLRGAVPILLAALAVDEGVAGAHRIYQLVFVIVAFSVIVQGTSIPFMAERLRVPMRMIDPEPWDLSIRVRTEPEGVARFVVGRGARAAGERIGDLPLGDHTWISLILRHGSPRQPRGSTVLEPGDELIVLTRPDEVHQLRRVFTEAAA
jgi:cell volume regulation protein A